MEHSVLMATEIKDEIFDCVPSNSFFSSCRSSSRRFQVGIRILFSINDMVVLLPFSSIFFLNSLSLNQPRFHMNVLKFFCGQRRTTKFCVCLFPNTCCSVLDRWQSHGGCISLAFRRKQTCAPETTDVRG